VLEPWQVAIVVEHPGRFLRGLFHSDGCRVTNWTTHVVAGERRRYEYPRYFFSNRSEDILQLCERALDLLGIEHRRSNRYSVSVARRESVAILDRHVGPKS
jgi:LAGLIDADG-like domain